jgi:hypothetical protein
MHSSAAISACIVVVSPALRPLYTALSDSLSELRREATRLYFGPDAVNWEKVQQLRQRVNALESEWRHEALWCVAVGMDNRSSKEAAEVLPGQAILSHLVNIFHQMIERLLRKEQDPGCSPQAEQSAEVPHQAMDAATPHKLRETCC